MYHTVVKIESEKRCKLVKGKVKKDESYPTLCDGVGR
jgi:hypothetical protein